jgi:hypothetical protein
VATGSAWAGTPVVVAKPAKVATGSRSQCEPWRERIEDPAHQAPHPAAQGQPADPPGVPRADPAG